MPQLPPPKTTAQAPFAQDSAATDTERLQRRSDVYESISELPFSVRTGPQTCFDHTVMQVVIGVEQLTKLGITNQRMVDFVVLHELGHFMELAKDPAGYLLVVNEGKRTDGMGQAYFGFYNSLMDIYVNTNTLNRAPIYSDGSGGFSHEVKQTYREQLFAERDFTSFPLSKQFGYYLLNLGMGTHADIAISPEVRTAVDAGVRYLGEVLPYEKLIKDFLTPAIGKRNTTAWRGTISQRKFVIDLTLRPVFERLLKLDLTRNRDPNETQPGDLEGFEASPGDFEEAIKEIVRRTNEANRSAEQRAQEARAKAAEKLASKHLTQEEAKDFADTLTRVYDHANDLSRLFLTIRATNGDFKKLERGHFKTGSSLDVTEGTRKWAKVESLPTEARIMKRQIYQRIENTTPHEIRLWLMPDLSGSMDGDIGLLKDLAVTGAIAINTLTTGVKLGQHTLQGSLGIIGYNDGLIPVLPLTDDVSLETVAKSYAHLNAGGGTAEHVALEEISELIRKNPPNDDCIHILIGITDGDTCNPGASRTLVQELKQLGVHLCAFKFSRGYVRPDVLPDPKTVRPEDILKSKAAREEQGDTFKTIWGTHGYHVRGAEGVLPAMKQVLHRVLRQVG